jgi:hypothetical protein
MRRYQGIAIRLISAPKKPSVLMPGLKEVLNTHESAKSVQELTAKVIAKYGIVDKLQNICTDRCSLNINSFRLKSAEIECAWIPCCCHLLISVIDCVYDNIPLFRKPIPNVQKALRGNPGP